MFGFALRCWDCVTAAPLAAASSFSLFFAVFNYFCLCMLQLLLLLLLHCSLFAAFSSLAVAQSIYCPALLLLRLCLTTPSPSPSSFSFLPRHITHVFYWPLATPTAAHLPLPHPTNRLSNLTLCVFSIAMPFNFLARPTTLRKPPGQPHLLQSHPPPLAALLPCCIPWLAVLCHLWLRLQLSKFLT